MPAFDDLIVGYRARDPRAEYADVYGGRCIACSNTVYFNASAIDILRRDDCDAAIVCDWCYQVDKLSIDAAMVSGAAH